MTKGDRVAFEARDLRDGERSVTVDGVVDRVKGEHVWIRVGGSGLMCVSRKALRVLS